MGFFDRFRSKETAHPAPADGKKEKMQEIMPFPELLKAIHDRMVHLNGQLNEERAVAKQIREMGGTVSRDAARSIRGLEKQLDLLISSSESILPRAKDSAYAIIAGAELAVEKPANYDELMKESDVIEVMDENLPAVQPSVELKAKEARLTSEAEAIENEMMGLVDQINALHGRADLLPTGLSEDIKRRQIGILRSRFDDLQKNLMAIRSSLSGIKLDLGMTKRLEGADMSKAA